MAEITLNGKVHKVEIRNGQRYVDGMKIDEWLEKAKEDGNWPAIYDLATMVKQMEETKEPGSDQQADEHKGINPIGVNIRTEKELADDLLLICQYRKQQIGWRTIAQYINAQRDYELSFSAYYKQYHDAKSSIQRQALENKDDLIEAELSEIDWQIDELTKAWKRSIGTKKKIQTKGGAAKMDEDSGEFDAPAADVFITEWEESGDPRYMAEITKLRERRAKILGFDAPDKVENTTKLQFSDLTDDQIEERLKRLRKIT